MRVYRHHSLPHHIHTSCYTQTINFPITRTMQAQRIRSHTSIPAIIIQKKEKKMKICFRNRKSLSLSINMCVRYSAYVYLCFCRIEFQIERWTVEMLNRCSQRCVCKVDRYMKGGFDFIKARELQRSSSASLSLKHEARAVMTTLKTFPFGESKREMLHTTVKESGNHAVGTTNSKQQRKKTKEKFFSFLALQTIFIESTWASDAVYIKWLPDSICLHKN